jgi:hypothetical protein
LESRNEQTFLVRSENQCTEAKRSHYSQQNSSHWFQHQFQATLCDIRLCFKICSCVAQSRLRIHILFYYYYYFSIAQNLFLLVSAQVSGPLGGGGVLLKYWFFFMFKNISYTLIFSFFVISIVLIDIIVHLCIFFYIFF